MENLFIKKIEYLDSQNRDIYEMLKSLPKDENGFGNPGYGIEWNDFPSFIKNQITKITDPDIKRGRVPQTIYWLFENNKPIGFAKMRHNLTDELMKISGHIGYSIIKEKRNKGYGTFLLKEVLKEIYQVGVKKVLLTCDLDNYGSRKVIENNNGVLEKVIGNECYYWIEIGTV